MRKLLILALLSLPAAVYSQELSQAELAEAPAAKTAGPGEADSAEPVARPDAQKIMSELSAALRLSSKQEERLSSAINKKMGEFDKLMKEFDKNSAEEKKWRSRMNSNRYEMLKLNREMPDTIREFLDDDQRQSYDELLLAGKGGPGSAAVEQSPAGEGGAGKPAKKKRLVKRRKLPPPSAGPGDEEAGQVMVDKEPQPAPRKKRVLKRKPVPAEPAEAAEPEAAKPAAKEAAPVEEDAGSYP